MKVLKRKDFIIMLAVLLSTVICSVPAFSKINTAQAAAKVKINKSCVTLYVGKTYTLKITGTAKTVKWSSSDKTVAAVTNKGRVTGEKEGTATITGTVKKKAFTCKVTVKAAASSAKEQTTVYGKVTAVEGSKITLALGTLNMPGGNAPASGSDSTNNTRGGTTPDGQPGGQPGSAPDLLTLTGKTVTINITDTSILKKQSMQAPNGQAPDNQSSSSQPSENQTAGNTAAENKSSGNTTAGSQPGTNTAQSSANGNTPADSVISTASLSDITVGSILKITYNKSIDNLVSVQILGAGQPGGTQPGGANGGTSSVNTGTGAYNLKDGEALTGGTYASTNADENAVRAEDKITASLTDVKVTKSAGAASSNDGSSFYGLDAAILALNGATLNITGGSVTAAPEGSNGVFAYNGATINIKDTKIDVSGGNAGGIEVAGGGILNATNLTVNTSNKAAIRSDRGGGTLTVNGGTYTTSGSSGAPAIYSTANITANDATLTANDSEAVVVEGLNSVTLNNCTVTGNMSGTYGSGTDNIHNVMLYQSMSGDAEVGNSSFTMNGGSLISKNGDMFYVTNTDCVIKLNKADLRLADNTKLLVVAGNTNSRGWGKAGANGGNCIFTVSNQTLMGDITVDKISKLAMTVKDSSTFTGSINSDKTAASACSVTLDSTSTWTLTADSYVTEFNGSMSNVKTNGHILYVNGVAMK